MSEPQSIKPIKVVLAGGIGGLVAAAIVACLGWQLFNHQPAKNALPPPSGFHWPLGGTTNTIVKVQGGSMTFRTPNDWTDSGSPVKTECTTATGASGEALLYMVGVVQLPFTPPVTGFTQQVTLNPGWSVDMEGRSGNLGTADSDGITLNTTSACSTRGAGILLTADSSSDTFYSESGVSQDDGGSFIRRFKNGDSTCSNDRDRCEHMSKIIVTAGTGAAPLNYWCLNGECVVYVLTITPG